MGRAKRELPTDEIEHPDVDERLVMPGSGFELLDGKLLKVPGADPPHATKHAEVAFLSALTSRLASSPSSTCSHARARRATSRRT
jgi:hypothetical protein